MRELRVMRKMVLPRDRVLTSWLDIGALAIHTLELLDSATAQSSKGSLIATTAASRLRALQSGVWLISRLDYTGSQTGFNVFEHHEPEGPYTWPSVRNLVVMPFSMQWTSRKGILYPLAHRLLSHWGLDLAIYSMLLLR